MLPTQDQLSLMLPLTLPGDWTMSRLFTPNRICAVSAFFSLVVLNLMANISSAQSPANQHYEIRQYQGVSVERLPELDQYLQEALVPALNRRGHEPVGVLAEANPVDGKTSVYLLIPLKSPSDLTSLAADLAKDEAYVKAAGPQAAIDPKNPLFTRVRSELLVAFNCWPQVAVPKQFAEKKDRLFEMRVYESATEERGHKKVEMFNNGEVPIFLDCGISPVFFGQAIIGDKTPNLTYMTVYDDAATRDAGWKKFIAHPDWKKLSSDPQYQNTVSKIHKVDLLPRPYSQL
jgi:hypothetical protein